MDFHIAWYIIIGILLMGYAVLDGFDLGVGALHLFTRGDNERRMMLNSIGPVWDGNEVWLVTAGGALFAAFPEVYATAFSSFYMALMILLLALIFRAVSIEFRSKELSKKWRKFWDYGFSIGSIVATIIFGVAIGNVINGIPLDAHHEFTGNFFNLLSPYTLLTGIFNLSMFTLHGAMYLILKTEGRLQKRIKDLALKLYFIFIYFYALVTVMTLYNHPEMLSNFSFGKIGSTHFHPLVGTNLAMISYISWGIIFLNLLAILNIPRCLIKGYEAQGFISSSCTILAVILFFALGMFPKLLISTTDPLGSLTIYNGASSYYTLKTMFQVAIWGMPFVVLYTLLIYWTFRGKTKITEESY